MTSTSSTSTSQDAIDVVNRYYTAINTRDWDAYDDLFTADAELVAGPGLVLTGPDGMRAFDQGYVEAFPDLEITVLHQIANDTAVSSENRGAGTHEGVLHAPDGDIPPTGRRGDVVYVGTFTIRDGRIATQHFFMNQLDLLAQLGLLPAPAASA